MWACLMAPSFSASAAELVAVAVDKHQETITLTLEDISPRKVFTLPAPDRLVVDVPALQGRPDVRLLPGYKGKLISKVRSGRFDPNTSRIVFEMNDRVRVLDIREEGKKKTQLVIAITASGASDAPSSSGNNRDESWPKAGKRAIDYADYKEPPKGKSEKPEVKPKKEKKAAAMSRRSKPVIVIDPGHGGVDPGAEGPGGSIEKDVVLGYAQDLQARLLRSGRYEVVLTREVDDFIMLRKRVEIARKAGAALFISLHADSAEDPVRGLSVYTLSEKASDEEAEALAARENKADVLAGMDLSDEREDVAGILISLAERDTKNRSATLADMLVTSLDDRVRLLPNSHRFAGFAVLKAPDVPSVLVEIGFLSHPKEEKLIRSKAYRDKVTVGIAAGIDRYFAHEKAMGGE